LPGQFFFFAAMGMFGTMAHYGVLIALVQAAHVNPILASTAGFTLGALTNYMLNYRFTFCSKQRHSTTIGKFYTVALIGLCFNALIMSFLTQRLEVHYLVAQVMTTSVVCLWNFGGNRMWTFGGTACEKTAEETE